MNKILAIFAHPDDEAYGPGSTLARYTAEGHTVSLLTLTRGEAGSLGPCKELSAEEVARMRSKELRCAADMLGISYLEIGDLPDKKLKEYPSGKGIALLSAHIREQQPDIVITFHDKGISGHPDHIAVAAWCAEAVRKAVPATKLFYYGVSEAMAESIQPERTILPFAREEITHILDNSKFVDKQIAAIKCHASQTELLKQLTASQKSRHYFNGTEYFSQIIPKPVRGQIKYDLLI